MHVLRHTILGLLIGMVTLPTLAGEAHSFNISAKPLATAIDSLSKQSGLHVFYAESALQGRHSRGG
jgi:hypothetical protein